MIFFRFPPAQHIITTRQQGRGNVISDEPGSSGDEDLHGGNLEGASGIIATPTTRGVPTMVRNHVQATNREYNQRFPETHRSSRPLLGGIVLIGAILATPRFPETPSR